MALAYIAVAVVSYLLGSIPFGFLLVKGFMGEDIRRTGSGNIGATNVVRSGAKGLGAATLALDALKGFLAVWLAPLLAGFADRSCAAGSLCALRLMALAALLAVLGHIFPAWLKFQGGKGVATAVGSLGLLFPRALLAALALFIVVVAVSRYVSLGSILAAVCLPAAARLTEAETWRSTWIPLLCISMVVILKHHQNIRRLLTGVEHRWGRKAALPGKQA